jgi:hypothetical protein
MEISLPVGTKVYKGFGNPGVGCSTLVKDTRIFFVTQNPRLAKVYSGRGTACPYVTKKPLRLFVLNHKNIQLVSKHFSRETRLGLQFVLGTNVLRGQQAEVYRRIISGKLPRRFLNRPFGRGERLSVTNINRDVFTRFAHDFLIPKGFDGFYSHPKKTGFHGGYFPAEIMLVDGGRVLKRPGPEQVPLLSRVSVIRELPYLFIQYCKRNRILLRSFRNYFVPYLGGGMGVRLYLEARKIKPPAKVQDTSDFDFTFAVSRKLKLRDINQHTSIMYSLMSKHLNGFIAWLNRTYTQTNAQLVTSHFIPPGRYFPATKKYIYRVYQFRIQFPGKEPMDFVDATLAHVPGTSREDIHPVYSKKYGLPIPRLKKLHESVAAVLAGSFVYKGAKPRNPIYGNRPEKGEKNVARLAALQNIAPKQVSILQNFIQRIKKRNVRGAKVNANKIIKYIQSKKK